MRLLCPLCHSLTPTYCSNNKCKTEIKQDRINLINKKSEEIILLYKEVKIDQSLSDKLQSLKEEFKEIMYPTIEKKVSVKKEQNKEDKTIKCIDCNNLISRGAIRCIACNDINKFKEKLKIRPSYEQLKKDMKELKYYTSVAKKYNVSDNCIRKWIKSFEKYEQKEELIKNEIIECLIVDDKIPNENHITNEIIECIIVDDKILKEDPIVNEIIKCTMVDDKILKEEPITNEIIEKEEHCDKKLTKKCLDCDNHISYRATRCSECDDHNKFKEGSKNRPSYEQLKKDFQELKFYKTIGKKYNVSDNTIRKWMTKYEKYS